MPPRNTPDLDFETVCNHFLNAFTYLERSVTTVTRHESGNVTWLHWPVSGRRGGRFYYEFFATNGDPDEMDRVVKSVDPKQLFFISDMFDRRGSAVEAYARLGYATHFQEPMMTLNFADLGNAEPHVPVADVESIDLANRIYTAFAEANDYPRHTSQTQIDDPQTLVKVVMIDGQPVATGKGILLDNTLYLTDIGTLPSHRKRGLGGAIMTALHNDARDRGATHAILSATAMAAPLYRSLGYRDVGTLDIYEPETSN